jgi:NADH:ubiquinone oxidoreductase subunit C
MQIYNNFLNLTKYLPIIVKFSYFKEQILIINKSFLLFVLHNLKLHSLFQLNSLVCISGVDLIGFQYRFSVVYELLSLSFNHRIRLKVFLNEFSTLSSISDIFINCVWWEREIWDLFGVFFENNPDLRRILTDYGFEGFPLRKDFPLSGFYGVFYSNVHKIVVEEPVSLPQEYRSFIINN